MLYDVNYFLRKFEAIPEENWVEGTSGWDGESGKFCADGFCGSTSMNFTEESKSLTKLLLQLNPIHWSDCTPICTDRIVIYSFNDGLVAAYRIGTPKQRILAALRDIQKLQNEKAQPVQQYTDVTKSLALMPIEETSDVVGEQILVTSKN